MKVGLQLTLLCFVVLMIISRNLHKKSSEVFIKTKSTPAALSLKGKETKHTTVKWSHIAVKEVDR